jgi:translocation and assembly module TamB
MGQATASATTLLHARDGSLYLEPKDRKSARVAADIGDLSWVSLFTGDAMEFGGSVSANLEVESRPDGSWNSSGIIEGSKLRVVRVDDGVRLLDGTLAARIADNRLILDKLSFPARLRAKPKEWRTEEWVTTNPDAQNGSVTITGEWDLLKSTGDIDINLYRYPILQRADRYAMLTGKLRLSAVLPRMSITGSVTADAGWFDLDMLGGIPTVDSDVVVIRPGETLEEPSAPLDLSMDLEVDLGPRFYLTGYGVNSGLRGNLHITMAGNKLTGIGALNTRGGAIETYGQRLQLRRGTITFQGDIANPILDIEALRTGLAVEAGVRVAGTARRPKIDLISYPAVSEIEKLSWLLLGHGPDDSGGDVALLFSVGSSFLSDGEPFYRKFGIDEISMRSGELGGSGSILPAESVVKGLDDSASDIERRFVIVSKGVANNLTLSLRQALSDTGTVGHLSYRLTRRLTAELSVGTVSGLALVYRWFSRD